MINFGLFVLFVCGCILFVNSSNKLSIIMGSMDDRFYGHVVDADLQRKIKVIDRLRCLKHFFSLLVSLFMMLQVASMITFVTYNVFFVMLVILLTWLLNRLITFYFFEKHKILDLYKEIKEQWSIEKKVSERHDEEVCFIRGVDDLRNMLFVSICWLITLILTFF